MYCLFFFAIEIESLNIEINWLMFMWCKKQYYKMDSDISLVISTMIFKI